MAKTTSQIVAENKAKRAEEAAIGKARGAINQKQLSAVSGSLEKTKAVLTKAMEGTTDAQKKAHTERAYKSAIAQYNAKSKEPQKSAVDQMWERASSTPQKTEIDDYRKRILDLQKQLTDAENAEIDWTSAADRQENARRQEELQSQIDKTRDEMNYRANMGKIDSMSEEQKQDLETLANSDNGFLSWMNIWDDQKALKALQNPEENEYAQRFAAKQRLEQSGVGGQQFQGLSETYQREMNRQNAEQAMEEARQKVQSGFGGAVSENAAAFANNLVGGVTGTLETADQAVRRAMGKSIYSTADTNRPGYRLSQKAAAAREATSEQILGEDPTLMNKAANLLYKGGTSAVDNVLRGLAGGGTAGSLALAGMGSFQDSYRSAAERGADDSTALLYGSVTAALEVATEFLPTEHLLGAKSAKECESLLRQAFVQAGLEIPGEEISLWGEIIADAYIMGDKSENNRLRAELIANGYSKEQADNEVMRRNLMESAETALTTLISSGGSVYVQGKADSARNKLAEMEARGMAANNAGQAQNSQQQESPAEATAEEDGLTDAQRYFRDVENGKTGNAGIERIIQQTADELSDNMPENKPAEKTDEQARLDDAMQRTIFENQRKQGEQEVYEALKAAKKEQKELQKEISRAERRLAETGKGSRARIGQLKAKLEQQDGLVRQLESQNQYFTGDYERTVGEAVQAQEAVFADAKARAAQAISDYEAGKITEAKKNAEVDAYNRAGAELRRLMNMSQDQYRADLAEAGLVGDFEDYNIQQQESSAAYSTAFDVDREKTQGYNNSNNKPGGMNNAGTEYQNGQQNDGAGGTGDPASGLAGVRQSNGTNNQGRWKSGGLAGNAGVVRLSEKIQEAHRNRGTQTYTVFETTGNPERYERALTDGRNSDKNNGWCVTPKSEKELRDGNVRTFMNESGTVGVGVAPDGDIVAVFKNKNGGPRKALDTLMPIAIEQGGDRLDCYGEGLVKVYSNYGFVPVARVEFNPKYANDGWTPDKGTPFIYVMKHNGDSADKVVTNMGNYDIPSQEQLNSLPTYGKDDYDSAISYRDSLMKQKRSRMADTQNMSANGGQNQYDTGIKGTGAAEANFSGKPAYNAALSEDNAQADRADDVRPMELPELDINGGKVSAVTGNAYGSRITPDDFASLMEEPTAKGDFSYMPISNDRATEMAKQSIERSGNWETAYADWEKAVARGQAGAEMSARGALLLNKAAQDGNKGRWLEILSDMRELGTNTAQGLQAFRLIRTLTPPDKLEFAKVSVRKLTESFARRSGLQTEITIDESLIKEYENAKTDKQRDEIMGRIQQNVADQIPSTFMDKFNALRYLNMLGNLKTTVRNVAGNVGASAAYRVKDAIAAGLERAAYTVSGGKTELTKSVFASPEMKKAAAKDFEQYAGIISDGGKFSSGRSETDDFTSGVMDSRRIFKTGVLEGARKATNWAMNNKYFGDEAFGRAAYSRALAGYLQANGVKETDFSKIDQTLMEKARAYAVKQAQEATFHDNNTVSKTLVKLQKDTGVVGQGILPFAKTPANVLVRAEEFSPLGFINSTIKTIQKAAGNTALAEKNGGLGNFARAGQEITGADLIDSWAKSFTGAGLFVLGAWLADQGWLIGSPDEDEDKAAFDKLNGIQPFSLMLPNGENITIDFLSPIAMTLFMGANAAKIWNERGDFTYEKLEKMATSLADPMIQMSMLQGVDNTLNDIKYADNNLGQFLINAGLSYLTQGFTSTLGGQVERAFEKERMTTYVDKNSSVPAWMQKQIGRISQKIPGWDYQQTAYIDARGQTQENMGGAEGLLYNLASPGYIDKKEIDAVSAELYRLNDSATFEGSIFPESPQTSFDYTGKDGTAHKDFSMNAEQADTLKRVTGQTGTKILADMVQSKDYAALTDNQKAQAVKLAYEYAEKKGRGSALEDYPEMSGWMAGIDGKEGRAILQKVARDTLQSAVSDWAEAIKNGWDTTGDSEEMESAYKVYDSMSLDAKKKIDDSISGDAAAYLEIRSGGVATEKYIDVVSGIKSLNPEKDYDKVRDIQIREEIAENRSLSAKERDIVMKAYMPDYDPKSKNPQTTELKYDEVRKLGVSAKGYSDSYRDYLDASGSGKRRRTIKLYMDTYGWDRATAQKVYDIYAGYYKPWEE